MDIRKVPNPGKIWKRFAGMIVASFLPLALAAKSGAVEMPANSVMTFDMGSGSVLLEGFDNLELSGKPLLVLNDSGLFWQGKNLCTWHGGRFVPEKSFNMVLEKCPLNLPVKTVWGDRGKGTAVLEIRYLRQRRSILELTYKGKSIYVLPKMFQGLTPLPD